MLVLTAVAVKDFFFFKLWQWPFSVGVSVSVQGRTIKQVESFRYLRNIISEKANCEKEIKMRTRVTKKCIWKDENDTD